MPDHPIKPCLFCKIAAGDVKCHAVYESPRVLAFLDICPIRLGHVQIIPRDHFDYYDDLPSDVLMEIAQVGQRLAPLLRNMFQVHRIAFLFSGADIAHAHAHVVPLVETMDITSTSYIVQKDLTFQSAPRASDAELALTADAIRSGLR